MRLMVTGGCGFIGSNFVRHMLENGNFEIVNLDCLTYAGRKENLKDLENNKKYKFIKGNICKPKDVAKAMKDCDAVINFAAESHVDRSIKNASQFLKTNVFGVYVLLEQARKQEIEKFIQIGTDEVYGSVEEGASKETDMLKPRNPYSASKAAADNLALSYYSTYGMNIMVTRSSNNFGPYQFPEKLIPLFITNLLSDRKVPLYGDGMNVRDWLYVKDNCKAIKLVLEKGKAGEIYNIGGGNEKRNIEITEILLNELGKGKEMIEYVKDRLGHDRRYCLDSSKIKEELGWQPETSFYDALKETIAWYKENTKWWKPLVRKVVK